MARFRCSFAMRDSGKSCAKISCLWTLFGDLMLQSAKGIPFSSGKIPKNISQNPLIRSLNGIYWQYSEFSDGHYILFQDFPQQSGSRHIISSRAGFSPSSLSYTRPEIIRASVRQPDKTIAQLPASIRENQFMRGCHEAHSPRHLSGEYPAR